MVDRLVKELRQREHKDQDTHAVYDIDVPPRSLIGLIDEDPKTGPIVPVENESNDFEHVVNPSVPGACVFLEEQPAHCACLPFPLPRVKL